jgi:hypothetical protein
MTRPRLLVPLLAAAALTGCGGRPAGPLADNVTDRMLAGAAVDVGRPASFGIPLYDNTSRALTLDRVVPLGIVGPVVLDGIGIATVEHGVVGAMRPYPPPGVASPLHRVKGWRIPAHSKRYQLIVGFHMSRPGEAYIAKIRVEYHDSRTRYAVDFPYSLEECAPYKGWRHGCPTLLTRT